jgi:putative ABC transport system permease protein
MTWIALKMLTGNRAKYFAMLFGVSFACMLMAQQLSLFVGLMRNTASQIRDIQGADIWVMDPTVRYVDDIKPLSDTDVYRVRSVPGVAWAVRLYKGLARTQFQEGNFKQFILLGLDDATLVGGPGQMLMGRLEDLRQPDAVVMDVNGWNFLWPDEPFHLGKSFEMNDHRAVVVGVCKASPTFQTFPIAYTRYSQAVRFVSQERRSLSFVLAKAEEGVPPAEVSRRITAQTGLQALSQSEFSWKTIDYYMAKTGIPVNFGTTVTLGFIIGAAIAGQTFYLFTLENLKQFGALKAMGLSNRGIVGMVSIQAAVVGAIGYGLGLGMAAGFERLLEWQVKTVPPAFYMAWQIPVGVAAAVALIMAATAAFSLRRVLRLEPAVVFRG